MRRKRRAFLSICLVLAVLVGLSAWFLKRSLRQEQIDVAFLSAVKNRDAGKALSLLQQGADVNTQRTLEIPKSPEAYLRAFWDRLRGRTVPGKTRWSALMLAVSQNDTALATMLLKQGAVGVNAKSEWTSFSSTTSVDPLLVIAVSHENSDLVRILLEHGASLEARGDSGVTALLAASYGLDYIVFEEKVLPSKRQAAARRYLDLLRLLLDHGADPQARNISGVSALGNAAHHDKPAGVALLLARGADARDVDPQHRTALTALHNAIINDNIGLVKLLLARGARVDAKGDCALALTSDLTLSRLLLDHGADPNAHYNGSTANLPTHDETALIRATRFDALPVVRLLLSRGADVNLPNAFGRSALMTAASINHTGNTDLIGYLIARGAAVNARDVDGETALMLAIEEGILSGEDSLNMIRFLLDHGAEINARDKKKRTALSLAAANEDDSMIALLTRRGGQK